MLPIFGIILLAAVALLGALKLNTSWFPTPQDEALKLETNITRTVDGASAGKDLGVGFSPGGLGQSMAAVVAVATIDKADGNETYKFVLQESADNVTYTDAGPVVAVTEMGVVSVPGWISKRYARLSLDVGGTTPSINYDAWLNPNV